VPGVFFQQHEGLGSSWLPLWCSISPFTSEPPSLSKVSLSTSVETVTSSCAIAGCAGAVVGTAAALALGAAGCVGWAALGLAAGMLAGLLAGCAEDVLAVVCVAGDGKKVACLPL